MRNNKKYDNNNNDLRNFRTISNSGTIKENNRTFSLACFWISVRDYLINYRQMDNMTITELRKQANFRGSNNEIFDANYHCENLQNIVNKYNVVFNIYRVDGYSSDITSSPSRWGIINNENNGENDDNPEIINIVNYGDNHFELIIWLDSDVPTEPKRIPEGDNGLIFINYLDKINKSDNNISNSDDQLGGNQKYTEKYLKYNNKRIELEKMLRNDLREKLLYKSNNIKCMRTKRRKK